MSKKDQKVGSDDPKSDMSSNGKAPAAASSAPPANAWSKPLGTKANAAQGPPPGMGKGKGQNSSNSNSGSGSSSSNGVQHALRERFIGLSLNMVGQKVVVTQTNGAVFEGIFHTFSPFSNLPAATKNKYVIKACRVIKPPPSGEEDKQPQVVDESTVIISADKVACVTAKSMRIETLSASNNSNGTTQQKSGDPFRTDTEISGGNGGRSRDFVAAGSAWTTGGGAGSGNSRAEALMGSLDDKDKGPRRKPFNNPNEKAGLKGSIGEWDQFRANQELFNVKATFDENLYTTELDKSQMDNKRIAEAERLAREIETTTTSNIHMAEERGHKLEGDFDEEDLYSGVLKDAAVKISIANPDGKEKPDGLQSTSQAPKKMNYAAAAAKADTAKKGGPPGFNSQQTKASDESEKEAEKDTPGVEEQKKSSNAAEPEKQSEKKNEVGKGEKSKAGTREKPLARADAVHKPKKEASDDEAEKAPAAKPSSKLNASKLNANAKEFTLNATARTFTPGGPSTPAAPPPATEGQFVDPNAAIHAGQVAGHMPGPHYMHGAPMGQPGMMPMMTPQFPGGVRYQAGYGGMDQQHMAQMQPHQAQHVSSSAQGSGAPSPAPGSTDEDPPQAQQDAEAKASQSSASQPQQQPQQGQAQQQPPQQQQQQLPYGVPPPGAYYTGGMAMHPRGPGGHPGYHPQFVGGPQQIPVGPGGAPYRHMYPMQPGGMAPNVQVRGPGAPYYGGPVTPVPYPPGAYVGHGMMDDESGFRGGGRGGGRGGRGRGGRGRGNRGGGRGGRGYNAYHQHGGRNSGPNQNQDAPANPPETWSGADAGNAQPDNGTSGPSQPVTSEDTSSNA